MSAVAPPSISPDLERSEPRFEPGSWSVAVERRYHRHIPGIVFVVATLVLAVGAINSQNNLLFLALGLALGSLVVSGIISGSALMGVRVRRSPGLRFVTALKPFPVSYQLGNANWILPAMGLQLIELSPNLPGRVTSPEAAGRRFTPAVFVERVGPRRSTTARAMWLAIRRGRLELSPMRISTSFPFGVTLKSARFEEPMTLLVRPAVFKLRGGILDALLAAGRQGDRTSTSIGMGEEIFGVREYSPGDSPRRIAWRPSARGEQLIVRQYASPTPRTMWVVLQEHDQASALQREYAIALVSSLLRGLSERSMAIGLAIVPSRPANQAGNATQRLASVIAKPTTVGASIERLFDALALLDESPSSVRGGTRLPLSALRPAVVVHAGSIDASGYMQAARHWSGDDLAKVTLVTDEELELLGSAEEVS